MFIGFILAVLTGITWTAIGVVLSRCAKNHFDVITYSMTQTAITALLAFIIYADINQVDSRSLIIMLSLILCGGMLNSIAQMIVKKAMQKGNHGPVWAISQASLIIPFLAGIILWNNHGTWGQWCGTAMIISGIILPYAGKFRDIKQWLVPSVIAFLLFGITQTMYSAPSQLEGYSNASGMRPMLVALGGLFGWEIVRRQQRHKFAWDKATVILAFCMALLSLVSLKIFFLGLDKLSSAGFGNIGIPLVVGSNIVGFALYSLLILREKLSRNELLGMSIVLAGITVIAL